MGHIFAAIEIETQTLVAVLTGSLAPIGGALAWAYKYLNRQWDEINRLKEELKNGTGLKKLESDIAKLRSEKRVMEDEYEEYRESHGSKTKAQAAQIEELENKLRQAQQVPQVAQEFQRMGVEASLAKLRDAQGQLEADEEAENDTKPHDGREYWAIAPCSVLDSDLYDRVWRFNLDNKVISIGWAKLGDISSYDESTLRKEIDRTYSDYSSQARGQYASMLWRFYHDVKMGDMVIARRGTKGIAGVGVVTRTAFYKPNWSPARGREEIPYPNHIGVEWQQSPRGLDLGKPAFGLLTVAKVPEEKFRELVGSNNKFLGGDDETDALIRMLKGGGGAPSATTQPPQKSRA